MPMLLCDCQSFIKESYLLTYLRRAQTCRCPASQLCDWWSFSCPAS